jgi:hypothetical protein
MFMNSKRTVYNITRNSRIYYVIHKTTSYSCLFTDVVLYHVIQFKFYCNLMLSREYQIHFKMAQHESFCRVVHDYE